MFVRRARFVPILLALLSTLVLSAGGARAAIVTMTYDGVIESTFGRASVFGRPFSELVGFTYRAVYRFDTEVGRHLENPTFESVAGGTDLGETSPWVSASMTVNGVTLNLFGDKLSVASTARGAGFSRVASTAVHQPNPADFGFRTQLYHSIFSTRPDNGVGARLDQPFVYEVDPTDRIEWGYFEYLDPVDTSPLCCDATLTLTPQRVTVSSAVPEPTVWIALVTGFGLLGTALRRRGRTTRTAIAAG